MQMRQFSSIAFFYRSPSKSVREQILLPLRGLAASIMHRPHRTIGVTNDLIKLVDLVIECLHQTSTFSMQKIKEEFSKEVISKDSNSLLLMDDITQKINYTRRTREKSPNYAVVKFMFNYYVFDILLFIVLRHHTAVNDQVAAANDEIIDYE